MRPSGMLRGASISASSRGIFMSRAIASTRPAQRSVRTGPGLTATKLISSLPYCAASASVRFCPAAFAAPGAISQWEGLTNQVDDAAAPLLLHDRQYVLQAAHITHEFELQRLRPM